MNNIDELINRLHGEGKSLREIAGAVSLSHVSVKARLDKLNKGQSEEPSQVDGKIDVAERPKLRRELLKIDGILASIEKQVGSIESILTPAGWKVSREPVNRLY